MQYQLVDPWGGMKQGMSDFTNTMQNIATIKQNKKRTQIMEEENERARAAHKSVMLKNQYQFVGMAYKTLDNIKDNKSYHETMKFMNNYADSLEKTSPDAAKQIRESMKKMPLYDGELYQGMEGRRKNPDSKFEAWRQQTQLGNLAMLKILGDDIKKDEVKFGTRTYTKTDKKGNKTEWKAESPEDAAAAEEEGFTRGKTTEKKEPTDTKSAFGKMLDEYFELPKDDPKRKLYEEKLATKGMKITTNPDGTTTIEMNAMQDGGSVAAPTKAKIEKDLLGANAQYASMVKVRKLFKPEYQMLGTRWKTFESKWKEKLQDTPLNKFIDTDLNDKDRKLLTDYSEYRREAIGNLNAYIKDVTGAQMSEKEAKRLMKAVPNPGMGLFDGDSPTEFKAKMDGVMDNLDRSIARYNYVLKNGLSKDALTNDTMSLESMDKIIQDRAKEIQKSIKSENTSFADDLISTMVTKQIQEEFGLRFN